jgi:hypothetical protein
LNYRDRLKDVHLRELEQHIRLEQEGQQKLALIAEHLQKHAQKVEQKLRQRSTFWGSIRYQLYLLRNILR